MTGRSLAVQYNVFFEQKEGNRFDQYEDAFALDGVPVVRIPKDADRDAILERSGIGTLRDLPRIWRVAVADGATGSSFSQLWARHLVESFISADVPVTQDFEAIREFTAQAADSWNSRVIHEILSGYKPGSMRHLRVKNGLLNTTQAATLLLMEFDTVAHTWRAAALGDTMVFQFSEGGLNKNRPFRSMTGETFGNNPILVTSSRAEQDTYIWKPLDRDDAYAEGSFEPEDDIFLLMTDAIAAYFLYLVDYFGRLDRTAEQLNEIEKSAGLFIAGRPIRKPKQDKAFADWAAQRRTRDNPKVFGRLKNDDITLIRLRFTTQTEGDTTPYEVYPYEPQTFPPLVELVEDDGPLAPTTPPPAPANTAPDNTPNRQTPSAKYPFSQTAAPAPQTAWESNLPAGQPETQDPPETPPAEPPVDYNAVLRPSTVDDDDDGGTFQKMQRVVTQPPAEYESPAAPQPTTSDTGGWGDLESDFKDDPAKLEQARHDREIRRELRHRKQQSKHGTQPPPKPTTLPPEYQKHASSPVTQPAPRSAVDMWFELPQGSNLIDFNTTIQRVLDRIMQWDGDSQFERSPDNNREVGIYITGLWAKATREIKVRWMKDVSERNPTYKSENAWEQNLRGRLLATIDYTIGIPAGDHIGLEHHLLLLRIYLLTWETFQYIAGLKSPPIPQYGRELDDDDYREATRGYLNEYKRLSDMHAEATKRRIQLPEMVREFWNKISVFQSGHRTRYQTAQDILRLKL